MSKEMDAYNAQFRKDYFRYETVKLQHFHGDTMTYELELGSGVDHKELKQIANEWLRRAGYKTIPEFWLNPMFRINWEDYGIWGRFGHRSVPVTDYIVFETTRTSMR